MGGLLNDLGLNEVHGGPGECGDAPEVGLLQCDSPELGFSKHRNLKLSQGKLSQGKLSQGKLS